MLVATLVLPSESRAQSDAGAPPVEAPVGEAPIVEPPVVEAPVSGEEPVAEEPAVEAPVAEEPAEPEHPEEPVASEPETSTAAEPTEAAVDAPLDLSPPPEGGGDLENLDLASLLGSERVTAASRTSESLEEVPGAVTLITRAEIQRWGYRSLDEILRHVAGFYSIDDHITPNVAVRGISGGLRAQSGLIQVTIDGRSVAYRATGARWLGAELIPVSLIERVEIILGPSSVVYGADAFLGVINIVTRSAEHLAGVDMRFGGSWAGGPGGDLDVTLGRRVDDVSFLVSWRVFREDRSGLSLPPTSPVTRVPPYRLLRGGGSPGVAQDLDLNSAVGLARITAHLTPETSLQLTAYASLLDRGAEFADWAQLASGLDASGRSRGNRVSLWTGYLDLTFEAWISPQLDLTVCARVFGGSPTDRDRVDLGLELVYARSRNDFVGGEVGGSLRWSPISELRFTFGADAIVDDQLLPTVQHVLLSNAGGVGFAGDVRDATSVLQGRRAFFNVGLYALGAWRIAEILQLHMGLRYDYHNIYESQLSGRGAVTLTILPGLSAKLIYGTAFRAPTPALLYGVPLTGGDILGNPDLRPQRTHTIEGELHWRPADWIRVQTGLSYTYLLDKAEFSRVGGNLVARNLAEAGIWSWDTLAQVDWNQQLRMYASCSVVVGVRNSSEAGYRANLLGSDLDAYPPVMARLGAHYTLPGFPFRFGVQMRYISSRRASDANVLENGAVYELPHAFYLDATLAFFDVAVFREGRTTFTLSGQNLLGETAPHPGFAGFDYPSAPRTLFLQIAQTF